MELNVLGLGDETERAYTALVAHPACTATELAAQYGGSTAAAASALGVLVARGLATRSGARPPRYSATPPDVAVTALIQEREHQLDAARSLVQRLAETHREANRISHPDIAVELLTRREDISEAAHRLTSDARRQVRAFDRPPYVDRPGSNLQEQVRRQRTGIMHRVIYSREAVGWPGRLHGDILPSVRTGEQARVRGELPLKLVVQDDRAALIPFSLAAGGHAAAYLVHRSPMLTALEALFEAEWERAVPLDAVTPSAASGSASAAQASASPTAPVPLPATASAPGDAAGPGSAAPDADTRNLLALLTSGLTDAAIGRALGWSPRTTQRRIQRLMGSLGATTRFQAALMAARRGWI